MGVLSLVHPDDMREFGEKIKHALETKNKLEHDYRVFLKDGTLRWRRITASFVSSEDDRVRFIAIFIDITDTMQSQPELELSKYYPMLTMAYSEMIAVDVVTKTFITLFSDFNAHTDTGVALEYEVSLHSCLIAHAAAEDLAAVDAFADRVLDIIECGMDTDNVCVEYAAIYPPGKSGKLKTSLIRINDYKYMLCTQPL